MKRALLALTMAACVLAACQREPEQLPQTQDSAPVIEAPVLNTSIGPGGAAGISAALPLTLEAMRTAAPNFIVAKATGQIEGQSFRMITLSSGDEVVFDVLPTADGAHIHSITTQSLQARGPAEDIVGVSKFGAAPASENMFCLSEFVDGGAGFACSTAADGVFWRVYKLPAGYDGPSEPFEGIDPDFALEATLAEMRWIAPRVGD